MIFFYSKNVFNISLILAISIVISSCSKDFFNEDINYKVDGKPIISEKIIKTENYLIRFADILSKAVYNNKEVRELLKKESLKQFDKNYDVLYYLVKDEKIGEHTFRDLLISYSSLKEMEEIEENVPLLNVYVSKIAFFKVFPEDLATNDCETPVVVSKNEKNVLYINGKEALVLNKGEIPGFHVFVVNQNSRVIIPEENKVNIKSNDTKEIKFKSPNYDGSITSNPIVTLKSASVDFSLAGQKAIDAYTYFNKDDGSIYQKSFQRDYVYYGITPTNQTGQLNRAVTEYISFIQIDPNAYFSCSDQRIADLYNNDPYISTTQVKQERWGIPEAELLDRMWKQGAYNFRIEISTSIDAQAQILYIPLTPDQLWNFNIDYAYVHSTWFRHSKHTYTINPYKFTPKKVALNEMVTLGKWDISNEALHRIIKVYEEDESVDITETQTYELTKALKINFGTSVTTKIGIGLKADIDGSTTQTTTRSVTTTRKSESDFLGKVTIYFYDPLIHDMSIASNSCTMHTYSTGTVTFGITVK